MAPRLLQKPSDAPGRQPSSLEESFGEGHHSEVLQPSLTWARAITWSLIGTTAFALGWLALAQTEQIVVAPGKLEPVGTVKEVQVPVGGVVQQVLVKEGEQVDKGQVLIRLDTEASADRQRSVRQTIQLKEEQLRLKNQELERYYQLNSTEQRLLAAQVRLQQDILKRLETLEQEGASAELQVLQQRNRTQEVQGQLEQSAGERLRQEAILNQEIQQLRSELSDLRSNLTELNVNLRYQEIRSPVNGIVFELKSKAAGFVAQGSEPVLKVVPFDKLEARVKISSSEIGFVSVGKPADISIDSFPASDFGVLEGTVRQIGSDALPPEPEDPTGTGYRFPASIQLSSQQLRLKTGQQLPLQVGMSLTANIKLRKVSYLQLMLGTFREKADALRTL
ncbi:HlyD family efflux transporter periplasmic adaptor subunit [Synechococcus sp. Cruz-9H2]|uniref:HlyD family secretion protein n=1 Tax=unclassified Synechococcus TaxID=2626047 RepID=UPI0020CB9F33|nr:MULTISPECIES: HlyD family efflux transporter periplasmic adaptor subunit [unclassified Synechococcus]MCP9820916.1 HlyD family efflux transporter periplasmic adaptor subunit [Synechococcus sp. Cruz-9H2]MCP9845136.1 HlyD family efflux transporter periplasmic adaptor subunit [Synechococcus sp. Edmonson 11F2]MCP9857306.1 HlyD family efflux transporter periplasmic adaptor subunit [Synechococcus sp. Cruz-9C9]MCP9864567.1 HlyD family efflux transporter periplasmic adaptor subunit [Synechococcus sp.